MKKHRLSLDDLSVESFDTRVQQAGRGTVYGHGTDAHNSCSCYDCSWQTDCFGTCGNSTHCSQGAAHTACDFSCEFDCGATGEGCSLGCPGTGPGHGGTTPPSAYDVSGCDMSCDFAC